ncbi:diaminopimelate epimerase [Candidatus Kinetoplastibacterium oncopeltii TCC290E]|uniref:Diaminopimelate epimerase n=1 Tax=Candidatus Kinetoplastidibacterium stringomonadis TCC290E TaxID=1208920 RepID=M1L7U4_9PROT|nr:diaminopimelate epimerase [Candidatus Kinetoplastibacterium oncopeltii]AGF48653.1 diaminopimelate epimerase [Candidatus Kinetoplastibacterium oncopeltii TCC290E]
MKLNFTKMHGIGNDFIVINGIEQPVVMTTELAKAMADRNFGIGADQILLVEKTNNKNADFRYRIFNANGSEVEHCGNGARCFVRFIHKHKLSNKNPIIAEISKNILISLYENNDNSVIVNMGSPDLSLKSIPFNNSGLQSKIQSQEILWELELDSDTNIYFSVLSIPNPHAVICVEKLDDDFVKKVGPFLESNERFSQGINVGFMQIIDRKNISIRVYERGSGETLSCGTGACAAVVSGIRRGLLDSPVQVHTRGGTLLIFWDGENVQMQGSAEFVFDGTIDIMKIIPLKNKY